MKLRDWKPDNWQEIKDFATSTYYKHDDLESAFNDLRMYLMNSLEKKVIPFQHSCRPPISGKEVKNPTLVIEPPMYLIDLGEPLR